MNRETFFKRIARKLSSIPYIGKYFRAKLPKSLFDSAELNELVLEAFQKDSKQKNLILFDRTTIVNQDDDEIVGKFKGTVCVADIITDDDKALVTGETGTFEFTTSNIPNIKMGSRVSSHMIRKEGLLQTHIRLNEPLDENFESFIKSWKRTYAESLAFGLKQRINSLMFAAALGGETNSAGFVTKMDFGVPEGVHAEADWTTGDAVQTITNQINFMADNFGKVYNRITMSGKAFRAIVPSLVEYHASPEFKALAFLKDKEGKFAIRDMGAARQLLANTLGMEIEIYDGHYYIRKNDGSRSHARFLPENKILFSNSADDNDENVFCFGTGVVLESIVSRTLGEPVTKDGEQFGPLAYFTGNRELNPPDIIGWAVMRGLPVLHDVVAFSSLTVKLPEVK